MNSAVTSREKILKICREMVAERGLGALNMRTVAQQCEIALGSVYNYFPSKNELTIAIIQSVWQDIFCMESCAKQLPFPAYVQWIFESVSSGMRKYPNFFTAHSVGFASENKGLARQTMEQSFRHMEGGLLEALAQDTAVRENAFHEAFTQAEFVQFVLSALLSLLMQQKKTCTVLQEMICRSLYETRL